MGKKRAAPFTSAERKTLLGCVIAYGGAYIGRHNIAMLLTSLRDEFILTPAQAGLVVSLFALTYAAGQLINGSIVDRINPRRYLLLGLAGSALCNLLLWLSSSYAMVLTAWCLNGAAQSMLWAPVVRISSLNFTKEKHARVSFILSVTMPIANMLAWTIAGQMSAAGHWRMGAFLPAVIMLLAMLASMALLNDCKLSAAETHVKKKKDVMSFGSLMFPTGLALLVCGCVGIGFVRDSIMNWGPTMLSEMTSFSAATASRISLIVPMLGVLGIAFGRGTFSLMRGNPYHTLSVMALAAAGWALGLIALGSGQALLFALMLSLLYAFLQGANPMISSLIPMMYDQVGRVGTVAGIVDCAFYVGSSLSGVLTGVISMQAGWSTVINTWWICCLIVALLAYASGKKFYARGLPQKEAQL